MPWGYDTHYGIKVGRDLWRFYITKPSQPTKAFAEWKATDCVNPFFWVTPTSIEEDANRVFRTVGDVDEDGTKFQVLINKRGVKDKTALHYYKEAAAVVPLVGAKVEKGIPAAKDAAPKAEAASKTPGTAPKAKRQRVVR